MRCKLVVCSVNGIFAYAYDKLTEFMNGFRVTSQSVCCDAAKYFSLIACGTECEQTDDGHTPRICWLADKRGRGGPSTDSRKFGDSVRWAIC